MLISFLIIVLVIWFGSPKLGINAIEKGQK